MVRRLHFRGKQIHIQCPAECSLYDHSHPICHNHESSVFLHHQSSLHLLGGSGKSSVQVRGSFCDLGLSVWSRACVPRLWGQAGSQAAAQQGFRSPRPTRPPFSAPAFESDRGLPVPWSLIVQGEELLKALPRVRRAHPVPSKLWSFRTHLSSH